MKNISSVISLSFLVLFLLVSNVNSSDDWVKYGEDNDGNVYSYKKENIEKNGRRYIVQVWDKSVYSDKGREKELQNRREYKPSTERWDKQSDKLSEDILLFEIDCKKKESRILSTKEYDTDGKMLYSGSGKSEWKYITPNSRIYYLQKRVCGSQKENEINEFSQNFIKKTTEYQKQELEYSKILTSVPQNELEVNDKLSKIDEYKNFLTKKNENLDNLINFFRETNLKYKKDKSIDKQIDKLKIITMDIYKTTNNTIDVLKKNLITGDKKYHDQVRQEYERQQPLKDEVTLLIINIEKSLLKD